MFFFSELVMAVAHYVPRNNPAITKQNSPFHFQSLLFIFYIIVEYQNTGNHMFGVIHFDVCISEYTD